MVKSSILFCSSIKQRLIAELVSRSDLFLLDYSRTPVNYSLFIEANQNCRLDCIVQDVAPL